MDILILDVSRHSYDLGLVLLGNITVGIDLPNVFSCLVPIHEWHVTVHQDQAKSVWIVLVHGLLNGGNSLLTVVSKLAAFTSILNAQDHEEAVNDVTVEPLVIDNQNLSSVKLYLILRADALIFILRGQNVLREFI